MAKKSRRHHFVPQFYTKQFAAPDGFILAYDKIDQRFYPGNPQNLFVERDRNTFENLYGEPDDVIEKVYATLDDIFDKVFLRITKTSKVPTEDYRLLLFFAYLSKWRVPQYDESFRVAKENYTTGDLGLGIKDDEGQRLDFDLEELFRLDMQHELKRILLAIQPIRFKEDFQKLLRHSFIIAIPQYPSFISDCPFMEAMLEDGEIFEDFVFPLTRELTLVYSTKLERAEVIDFLTHGAPEKIALFERDFASARDISLLALAERQVACADPKRMQFIVKTCNERKINKGTEASYMTWFYLLNNFKQYL
jgi:hypothetical protein